MKPFLMAALAASVSFAGVAFAQDTTAGDTKAKVDNLEKLGNFRQTGVAEPAPIPQTGRRAEGGKREGEQQGPGERQGHVGRRERGRPAV